MALDLIELLPNFIGWHESIVEVTLLELVVAR